ncbi:hypothetical protein FRC06_007462, partial [Ceratobasidium sp. 370]
MDRYAPKSECFARVYEKTSRIESEKLVDYVRDELAQLPTQPKDRSEWEYVIRARIWEHVAKEGEQTANPETRDAYFSELSSKLDIALVFTELEVCNWQFVLEVLEEVLDAHTVDSCITIFDWVENRSARLLKGMVPSKGKALVVLRTLNALKARAARTGFAGRLLTFQSGIFDITERSGVNLPGELGSVWDGVAIPDPKPETSDAPDAAVKTEGGDLMEGVEPSEPTENGDKKPTAEIPKPSSSPTPSEAEQRRILYNTFWQLQLFFAKPLAFAEGTTAQVAAANGIPTPPAGNLSPADVFAAFKKAVDVAVPVLSERTRKDNALMGREGKGPGPGASALVGVKRKRASSAGVRRVRNKMEDESARETQTDRHVVEEADADKYFFAKFLTSPDLLDLELADTNFRRQILFQLVVALKHLLLASQSTKPPPAPTATPLTPALQPAMLVPNAKSQPAKASTSTPAAAAPAQRRKRQLMGEVTLSSEDESWVRRMMSNCLDEWRATSAGSIRSLIARDEHWVDWKNKFCQPFERRDFDAKADEEVARKNREDMIFRPLDVWRNPLGSASLTAVWDSKYNGPEDLEDVIKPPSMQKFENLNKSVNLQIQRAEAAIAAEQAMRKPPPPPAQPESSTSEQPPATEADSLPTAKPIAKSVSNLGVPTKPGVPSRPGTPGPGAQPQSTSIIARPNDEELPRAPKPAPRLTPKQRMLEEHQL